MNMPSYDRFNGTLGINKHFLFMLAILSKFVSRHGICSRWHELKSDGSSKIKKLMPLDFIQAIYYHFSCKLEIR